MATQITILFRQSKGKPSPSFKLVRKNPLRVAPRDEETLDGEKKVSPSDCSVQDIEFFMVGRGGGWHIFPISHHYRNSTGDASGTVFTSFVRGGKSRKLTVPARQQS